MFNGGQAENDSVKKKKLTCMVLHHHCITFRSSVDWTDNITTVHLCLFQKRALSWPVLCPVDVRKTKCKLKQYEEGERYQCTDDINVSIVGEKQKNKHEEIIQFEHVMSYTALKMFRTFGYCSTSADVLIDSVCCSGFAWGHVQFRCSHTCSA